jgi:hypothetical protein
MSCDLPKWPEWPNKQSEWPLGSAWPVCTILMHIKTAYMVLSPPKNLNRIILPYLVGIKNPHEMNTLNALHFTIRGCCDSQKSCDHLNCSNISYFILTASLWPSRLWAAENLSSQHICGSWLLKPLRSSPRHIPCFCLLEEVVRGISICNQISIIPWSWCIRLSCPIIHIYAYA